jgi:hypothetical protein
MDNETALKILKEKFGKFEESLMRNKRYFHQHTVKNFLIDFSKIPNENAKGWILKDLDNCLDDCENHITDLDRDLGRDLYIKYLDKIADYYRENLAFTFYAHYRNLPNRNCCTFSNESSFF